jgi:hypothetical protein
VDIRPRSEFKSFRGKIQGYPLASVLFGNESTPGLFYLQSLLWLRKLKKQQLLEDKAIGRWRGRLPGCRNTFTRPEYFISIFAFFSNLVLHFGESLPFAYDFKY